MPKSADRIIIDTNLWISFLLTKDYSKLDAIFSKGLATLIFSEELLEEFIGVARKQKFKALLKNYRQLIIPFKHKEFDRIEQHS